MTENRSTSSDTLFVLLVGAVVGAAAGLLFAPRPGRDTRKRVRRWIDEVEESLEDDDMESLLAKGKDVLREKADHVRTRVESALRDKAKEVRGTVESTLKQKADELKNKVREVLRDKEDGSKDDDPLAP